MALDLFGRLGLHAKLPKGVVTPTRRIEFLGYILDSTNMSGHLPKRKVLALLASACTVRSLLLHTTGVPILARSCSAVSRQPPSQSGPRDFTCSTWRVFCERSTPASRARRWSASSRRHPRPSSTWGSILPRAVQDSTDLRSRQALHPQSVRVTAVG